MSEAGPEPTDVGAQLTRKLGPLPVWGWGLAGAAGIGLAAWLRNRGTVSSDASTAVDNTGTDLGDVPDGTGGAAFSDPSVFGDDLANPDVHTGTGLPTGPDITSNNEWRQLAVRAIMGAGHAGLEAEKAVGKYLAGQRLTPAEQTMINTALSQLGDTPTPAPLQPGAKPPNKNKKPKPGKGKHHGKHPGKRDPNHPHPKPDGPRRQDHGHQDGLPKTHNQHGTRHHHGPNRRDEGRL